MAQELRHYAGHTTCRSLFQGQPEQAHADAGPWLLHLDQGNSALVGYLDTLERSGVPCMTLLISHKGYEYVFAHLQSMLDMRLADGSKALLRYYDPRVMKRLRHILSAEQFSVLLAPFAEWTTNQGRYSRNDH